VIEDADDAGVPQPRERVDLAAQAFLVLGLERGQRLERDLAPGPASSRAR
jgi:hypothetical protein